MSIDSINIKPYQKKLGAKIRQLRHDNGLSQSQLAAKCNLEKTSISRIENGRVNVTLKTIVILSSSLDVSIKEIFDFE